MSCPLTVCQKRNKRWTDSREKAIDYINAHALASLGGGGGAFLLEWDGLAWPGLACSFIINKYALCIMTTISCSGGTDLVVQMSHLEIPSGDGGGIFHYSLCAQLYCEHKARQCKAHDGTTACHRKTRFPHYQAKRVVGTRRDDAMRGCCGME